MRDIKFRYELGRIFPHIGGTGIDISLNDSTARQRKPSCRAFSRVYTDNGGNRVRIALIISEVIG